MGPGVRYQFPKLVCATTLLNAMTDYNDTYYPRDTPGVSRAGKPSFGGGHQVFHLSYIVCCRAGNPAAAAAGLPLLAYDVVYAALLAEQGLVREAMAYISAAQVGVVGEHCDTPESGLVVLVLRLQKAMCSGTSHLLKR